MTMYICSVFQKMSQMKVRQQWFEWERGGKTNTVKSRPLVSLILGADQNHLHLQYTANVHSHSAVSL